MSSLGNHILVEFSGCSPEIMNDVITIEEAMVEAAEKSGATVINSTFHHFSPFGVSGVVVIQESHLAIHTWPEYQYAAVDLFTCGDDVDAWIGFDHLKEIFEAGNYSALEMKRGSLKLLDRIDFNLGTMRDEAKKRTNPDKYNRNVWFTDKDDNQALSLRHTGEVLFNKKSDFQQVRVLNTYAYGKMLTIDNMVMCTERDEAHYHEMITHPGILGHGSAKNVLVIGGGDGGTIREIVKHNSVEKVTMVEIDEAVVEASKLHLPTLSSAFDHEKLDLIIGDGIDYVAKAAENSFDIIIVDGSDPVGPAEGLFSRDFYTNCHKALAKDGILIVQTESPLFNAEVFIESNVLFKEIFGEDKVFTTTFSQPTYPTGTWSMMYCSKGTKNPLLADKSNIEAFCKSNEMGYYNSGIHFAAFALPSYIKKMLHEE